jgi:hypothetical protein
VAEVADAAAFGVGGDDRLGDLGEGLFESNVGGHDANAPQTIANETALPGHPNPKGPWRRGQFAPHPPSDALSTEFSKTAPTSRLVLLTFYAEAACKLGEADECADDLSPENKKI